MKSIKSRLIVSICAITFAICVISGVISSILIYNTARNDMDMSVSSSANAYSYSIENAINIFKTKLESMATDNRVTPASTQEEIRAVCQEMAKNSDFLVVSYVDANGVPYDQKNTSLADREYFKAAMSGTTYISSPVVSKREGANNAVVLYIAAKVNNGTGYNGVILAELPNDIFSQIIKDVTIGENGYGFVVDKTGTIVAHKDNSRVESFTNYMDLAKKDPTYSKIGSLVSEMLDKKTGKGEANFEGSEKYVAYAPVNGPEGWVLAMVADKNEMMKSFREGITISIIVALVFIAVSIVFSVIFGTSVGNPIKEIAAVADKLAVGDIDVDVRVKSKDETGQLANSFRNLIASIREQVLAVERIADADLTVEVVPRSDRDLMGKKLVQLIQRLNDVMSNITIASEQVANGARQISDSSMALSQGATEQASSIEELSASIEEISSQTRRNAENAEEADKLAAAVRSNAEQCTAQMAEMLRAMEEINVSSSNISKIIKVIDDIAFQTNMLALNAAVEAARAGQHGKGFAVVAEEVKNLAARSANAAKETTEMIEGSIEKTEAGTVIAKNTSEALNKIVSQIEKVAELVNNISVASKEQDTGISQINQGIMQVSQVVQTNSATSEESAAASEELSGQAEMLRDMVNRFKLKENAGSRNKQNELNPEVIRMLENMSAKAQNGAVAAENARQMTEAPGARISLNDMDFGKY